ncbi:DUF1176 domain-containing protein [Pseudomonas resinovorans]|uniref:DUF1176 domain-containing protein n=1 Tax=Metapseudomonas resinovorans TaxID=53412 RepID=A0ABT4YD39_METRE|nr:DUF1176 domain-containing protein [Pseudomonas resinovorans]MDA8486795.1 DUF1176 domain-containing protein [Pseudomonas resinovorans]
MRNIISIIAALSLFGCTADSSFVDFGGDNEANEREDATTSGINFAHKEWQLVCDSTHTCRATAATANTLALMITRKAGPNQLPVAKLRLSDYSGALNDSLLIGIRRMVFRVDDFSEIAFSPDGRGNYLLDEVRAAELIDALKENRQVVFEVTDYSATPKKLLISGDGAYAIFLKMDEIQKRAGTFAALVKKGSKDESEVLLPRDAPVVKRVMPQGYRFEFMGTPLEPASMKVVREKLIGSLGDAGDCPALQAARSNIYAFHLNKNKLLLSASCQGWPAAFELEQSTDYRVGYWVIDKNYHESPSLVTLDATHYGNGLISTSRSPAMDCYESKAWIWDGVKFVLGNSFIKGICNRNTVYPEQWELPINVVNEIIPDTHLSD